MGLGGTTEPGTTAGYSITWDAAGAYTGMVIKKDPGQPLIWIAYLSLIMGLMLTFYFPRRRVWARLHGDASSWPCWPTATSTPSASSAACWTTFRPALVTARAPTLYQSQ